ncbi:MAG: hypothetical protein IT306_20370 [Chloroflexi bacterium]|nr:hypothetical protein [Chloroflexota bacterium]
MPVKLVQMPPELVRIDEVDIVAGGYAPSLLAAYQAYLPMVLEDRQGVAILASAEAGGLPMLMLLARRVGAALRDENIQVRDAGGDMRGGKKRLCYVPGTVLDDAYEEQDAQQALATEAACFVQELETVWAGRVPESATLTPSRFLSLLDQRRAAGLPTFVQADPARLPEAALHGLRSRLRAIEPA